MFDYLLPTMKLFHHNKLGNFSSPNKLCKIFPHVIAKYSRSIIQFLFLFALFKILLLMLSPQSHITEAYLETNLIVGISLFLPNTAIAKNTENTTIHLFYPSEKI